MFEMPWVKDSFYCSQDELKNKLAELPKAMQCGLFVAYHSDGFSSGFISDVGKEITDTLLELRVFHADCEFRALRTMLGEPFACRVADEAGISEKYWFAQTQYLDIDKNKSHLNVGVLCDLVTTGGGAYKLPCAGKKAVKIIIYLSYNEAGMAHAVDYRMCEFTEVG